jgi:LPPG:FO 2-phospho-L-lactate transferase
MRITVLAGGVGAARFLRGLQRAAPDAELTVIGNTGDDITLFGLRVCPDLDTVMYTLGGGINEDQGWGRDGETFSIRAELAAYGASPDWFTLGDRDFATHILRSQMLAAGQPLSAVTEALCRRWQPGVRLLPMSDDPVETHVVLPPAGGARGAWGGGEPFPKGVRGDGSPRKEEQGGSGGDRSPRAKGGQQGPGRRVVHFQEWWVRMHAETPAAEIVASGAAQARPAPGVLEAIGGADVVLFPPSNPVVSIGTILAVPGIRAAVAAKTVVGVSPIIGGAPVRGMADACLAAIGVDTTAAAVAAHYGPGLIDGWLVDDQDKTARDDPALAGIEVRSLPLLMRDPPATTAIARAALDLALELRP